MSQKGLGGISPPPSPQTHTFYLKSKKLVIVKLFVSYIQTGYDSIFLRHVGLNLATFDDKMQLYPLRHRKVLNDAFFFLFGNLIITSGGD